MSGYDWNNAPEIVQFLRFPATAAVIGTCSLIWFYIWRNGIDYSHVGSSYRLVVIEHQYWRAFSASLSHISLIHLGFNMFSSWQLRNVEMSIGIAEYFRLTFIFLILSICVQQSLHAVLARTRFGERTQNTIGVGYSCVVFAWMTFASLKTSDSSIDLILFKVPFSFSPFFSLVVTQMIIPNVDFVGHLAGILAGYIEGWGLVRWLAGYWLLCSFIWAVVLCIASLTWSGVPVSSPPLPLPYDAFAVPPTATCLAPSHTPVPHRLHTTKQRLHCTIHKRLPGPSRAPPTPKPPRPHRCRGSSWTARRRRGTPPAGPARRTRGPARSRPRRPRLRRSDPARGRQRRRTAGTFNDTAPGTSNGTELDRAAVVARPEDGGVALPPARRLSRPRHAARALRARRGPAEARAGRRRVPPPRLWPWADCRNCPGLHRGGREASRIAASHEASPRRLD
jgi:membrane associated rhomboid family serine protease